jgi:arsenate reductase-like glutaredoxin family protein
LSEGEWKNIFQALDAESLVDENSSYYGKAGYAWREYDAQEELRAHPQLLRTPLLRVSRRIALGFDAEFLLGAKDLA